MQLQASDSALFSPYYSITVFYPSTKFSLQYKYIDIGFVLRSYIYIYIYSMQMLFWFLLRHKLPRKYHSPPHRLCVCILKLFIS